jgi:peptidoglycan/LPS O-acetylase OafA/YrhL
VEGKLGIDSQSDGLQSDRHDSAASAAAQAARKVELPALTGLRFVAAFSILFLHATEWTSRFNDTSIFDVAANMVGLIGMPLFFVLSGFVIHYNYASSFRDRSYGSAVHNFLGARFARIYPLFFFFCVFGSVADFTTDWISYDPSAFFTYIFHFFTLTQSWVYKIVVNQHVLFNNGFGLSWSLSCEFFFYLAYVVFVFAILTIKNPLTNFIIIAVFALSVISALLLIYAHLDALTDLARAHIAPFIDVKVSRQNSFVRWLFYYSPYGRIWEFILGCLVAHLFLLLRERPISNTERRCGLLALYAGISMVLLFDLCYATLPEDQPLLGVIRFLSANFGCAVPLAVVIFCAARYESPVASFLSMPGIIWLGDISYSIYAVHTWTLRPFIRRAVGFDWIYGIDTLLRIGLAIGFTIIVASATYAIIEVPCRRYFRAKLMRPSSAAQRA